VTIEIPYALIWAGKGIAACVLVGAVVGAMVALVRG
jgi:hypothetical protein